MNGKLKIWLRGSMIVLSCMMIIWYMATLLMGIGSIAGILFFTWIGLNGIYWEKISEIVRKMKSKRSTYIFYRTLCVLCTLMCLWIVGVLGAMAYFANQKPQDNATAVVLGCQTQNGKPSQILSRRIDAAYEYLVENPDAKCIVSGGQGADEIISEAECMYNELVARGIAAERIYKEDKSTNTSENIAFSVEIIKREKLNENLAIVTDGFHEMRAAITASRLGYSCGAVSARTPFHVFANLTTREVIAVTASVILKR